MAPPRRTTRSTKPAAQQSQLSFRSTKATTTAPGKDALKSTSIDPPTKKPRLSDPAATTDLETTEPKPDSDAALTAPTKAKVPHAPTPKDDAPTALSPDDPATAAISSDDDDDDATTTDPALAAQYAAARALPTATITRYWAAKERARRAPRVHQAALSTHDKVLREWDVAARFGPSIGITREQRWRRAWGLGLAPPVEVLAVLLREEGRGALVQVSVVDELMGSTARGAVGVEG